MIYTVTFNPSLDYIVSVKDFRPGMTNRTSSELMLAGGKGINVSIVLGNLGIKSTALGFIAGFTGDEIVRRLHNGGINSEFIKINDGISRINIKLKSIDGTEINGQGPHIDSSHIEQLMNRLRRLESGDVLVLAGSIPAGISDNIYKDIMDMLKDKGVQIVVDAVKTGILEHFRLLFRQKSDGTAKVCSLFFHFTDAAGELFNLGIGKFHAAKANAVSG